MAERPIPPLDSRTPIVDGKGVPRPPFILLINKLLNGSVSAAVAKLNSLFAAKPTSTTLAVTGKYDPTVGVEIELKPITPDPSGTYGDSTHFAVVTIDEFGRVTAADQEPAAGAISVTDGATTVAGVSTLKFTSGATVTAGGAGEADVAISGGGGGGGSGGGNILAHSFSNLTANEPSDTSPTGAPIPDMSVTFMLPAAADVFFGWDMLFTRGSGNIHIFTFVDGVIFQPQGANTQNWMGLPNGEQNGYQARGGVTVNLAAGSHTIALNYSDAFSVSPVTFLSRSLIAEALAAGGGGTGGQHLIGMYTTVAGDTSVHFDVPAGYAHLKIAAQIGTTLASTTLSDGAAIQFNGDTGNNYDYSLYGIYFGNSSFGGSARNVGAAEVLLCTADGSGGPLASQEATVLDYGGSKKKSVFSVGSLYQGNIGPSTMGGAGSWNNTDPITSIDVNSLNNPFSAGSTFWLYGIN